jgi:hypothetical protein
MSLKKLALGTAVALTMTVGLAQPAQAAGQDAVVNNNEFILYYNSNKAGSFSDFLNPQSKLHDHTFIRQGLNGFGQTVVSNTASVDNRRNSTARIYINNNYGGPYDSVGADSWRNLERAYNRNFSFRWI